MASLWEDGMEKVLAGISSVDEIMREAEKLT
jgi:hypothetical protein